jgi:type IV pilus assembly protein PilC
MPNYFYTAKSIRGKTVTGTLVARDMHELSQSLKDEGLIIIKAVVNDPKKRPMNFSLGRGVPVAEKIMMTRNLSVMVATGLPLIKSFDVLAGQTRNQRLKDALLAVREKINKGESLHSAMAAHPDVFNDFFLSMVEIGEEAGTLEEVLKILAMQLEKEHRLKSEIQGAMIYPGIVMTLLLFVGGVMVVVVLPKLNTFFTSMAADIPFYTRMLLSFGQFAQKNWGLLAIAPVVAAFLIWLALKTKTGRWIKDTISLRIPLVSELVKKNNCAVLIRSLSSLLGSGVAMTRSLEVASGTVGNFYFKKAINESLERIKKGEKLYEALGSYKDIFPFGTIEMLQVGEETGKTSNVLKTLADFYEEELIATTAKLSAALEPMLILFLGAMVAFFAFSIIEPMYSSLQFIG